MDHRVKIKENEKRDKYFDHARELNKAMEHECNGDTNYNKCTRNGPPKLGKRTGKAGNQMTGRDHPHYSITKIGQNTEKSPGDLKRLAVNQTPVKDHQLTLVWKTRKENINDNDDAQGLTSKR